MMTRIALTLDDGNRKIAQSLQHPIRQDGKGCAALAERAQAALDSLIADETK